MTMSDAIALNWKLDAIVRRVKREVIMHVLKDCLLYTSRCV